MNRNIDIPEEEFITIEHYLSKELPGDEYISFQQKLQDNQQLQEKVKQVQLLLLGVQEASLEDKLNGYHKSLISQKNAEGTGKVRGMKSWLLAAAVIGVIVIGCWIVFIGPNKEERIFTEYFKADPGLITAMGSTDNYSFERAMVDYKTGNYDSAIKAWESLLTSNPASDTLNYFLGSSYLATDQSEKSVPYFKKVIAKGQGYFLKDTYWYLGLVLLKEGKKNEAISLIEKSDHDKKDELLARLKE